MSANMLQDVAADVVKEHMRARTIHAPMHSLHEGYAILKEEVDEFWDLVKMNRTKMSDEALEAHYQKLKEELIQISAMAQRLIVDVVEKGPT
jgi:hypothetical protein